MERQGRESVVWLDIGHDYRLQATAEEHLQAAVLHEGEQKDASTSFDDAKVWLQTIPAERIDYAALFDPQYVPDSAGKLLTYHKDTLKQHVWHRDPAPVPQAVSGECSVRFRVQLLNGTPSPWVLLEKQTFELASAKNFLVKHFFDGMFSILLKRVQWNGPFVTTMSPAMQAKYLHAFHKHDQTGQGKLTTDQLRATLAYLGMNLNLQQMFALVDKYTLKSSAITFDHLCEIMECSAHGGKAWFVCGIRVAIPKLGFEEQVRQMGVKRHRELMEQKVRAMFDELDTEGAGAMSVGKLELMIDMLDLAVPEGAVADLVHAFRDKDRITYEDMLTLLTSEDMMSSTDASLLTREARQKRERRRIEAKAKAVLYQLKGTEAKVRKSRVECHYSSLNSGDVFILDGTHFLFLWVGLEAHPHEFEAGKAEVTAMTSEVRWAKARVFHVQQPPTCMELGHALRRAAEQGDEPRDFWFILGGQGPVTEWHEIMADDVAEGIPDPVPPMPSPRKDKPRCCVVGAGIAGAICARIVRERFGIEVVVLESGERVGGRLGSMQRAGVPFSAGASYFCASGPHMKPFLREMIEECGVQEWNPRVGVLGKGALIGSEIGAGFIPPMGPPEGEVNIEAWLESRPQTGAPGLSHRPSRPATAYADPVPPVSFHALPPPNPVHRRSHMLALGQGNGSQPWYICKPEMANLVTALTRRVEVRTQRRVQRLIPRVGTGQYEVVCERCADGEAGQLASEGLFSLVLLCTPPDEAARLLCDVQPGLAQIPASVQGKCGWVVMVAFDHPVFTPYDVLLADGDAAGCPIQAAVRQECRTATSNPFRVPDNLNAAEYPRSTFRGRPLSPLWAGAGDSARHAKPAPSRTVYGSSVDSWVLYMSAEWSEENRHTFAPQVAEVAVRQFLTALSMPNAELRLVVSDAVLWEYATIPEPAGPYCMSPSADPAFSPYCVFDPVTGLGAAGDWCVEGSVEGAFVSGLELAARAGRSPIMHNEGVAHPYGHVQVMLERAMAHRQRHFGNREVLSGYSSDSMASTRQGSEWGDLEWEEQVLLQDMRRQHGKVQPADGSDEWDVFGMVRKTTMCPNEGCGVWVPVQEAEAHAGLCQFRRCLPCPFPDCGQFVALPEFEHHKTHCRFGSTEECPWCFALIALPDVKLHRSKCIARPRPRPGVHGPL